MVKNYITRDVCGEKEVTVDDLLRFRLMLQLHAEHHSIRSSAVNVINTIIMNQKILCVVNSAVGVTTVENFIPDLDI